uniref:Ribosomal protein L13 n=1 Tax=Ptilothamnion sphaericum TaxID=1498216 RepID=A0A4D6X1B2_9FLOR|nr:ribosomal protein L13 [Ptilothamnion sphaericum]
MFLNHNKTHTEKKAQHAKWYIIDAKDKTLGRLSSKIAYILKGKNSTIYTPNHNQLINIIIINSKFIHITGKKKEQIIYKRHSGRPGGLKQEKFNVLQNRLPNRIVEKAIKGMLPKNTLGKKLFTQLKIYSTDTHPHQAQKPVILH